MANIKDKIAQIRQAIFGKEVRESIASGIEAINKEVENTTARQDNVEAQFQAVLDETTDKDVISAPEITAARVGADNTTHSNLKARLDAEHNKVMLQLAEITSANKKDYSLVDDFIKSIPKNKILAYYEENEEINPIIYVTTKNKSKVNHYTFAVPSTVDQSEASVGGSNNRVRDYRVLANLKMYAGERLDDSKITIITGSITDEVEAPREWFPGDFKLGTITNRTVNPETTFVYKNGHKIKNMMVRTGTGACDSLTIKSHGVVLGVYNLKDSSPEEERTLIIDFPYPVDEVEVENPNGWTRIQGFNIISEESDDWDIRVIEQHIVYGDPIYVYRGEGPENNYALLIGSPSGDNFKWAGGYHGGERRTSISVYAENEGETKLITPSKWHVLDAIHVLQETLLNHPSYSGDIIKVKSWLKVDYLGHQNQYEFDILQDINITRATVAMSINLVDVFDRAYIPNIGVVDLTAGTTYMREHAVLKYNSDITKPLVLANIFYDGQKIRYHSDIRPHELALQQYSPINANKTYFWWIGYTDQSKYVNVPKGFTQTFRQRHILHDYRLPIF